MIRLPPVPPEAVMAPALLALLRLGRFDREIPRAYGAPEPAAPEEADPAAPEVDP